jgi:methylenetetrahydrofolate reductase (NADPH)
MAIDASENRSRLIETGSNRQSHDVGLRPEHRRGGLLGAGGIDISFEFYPPSSPTREDSLWRSIRRLEGFSPINVAITDQGTKSTRKKTHATVERILKETKLTLSAHLTCVNSTKAEIDAIARRYWNIGVRHIVALRGDEQAGQPYTPHPDGYGGTAELVKGLIAIAPFEIAVSAYPEKHPASPTYEHDIDLLKAKIDAGATTAITQYFFDNDAFLRFRDRLRAKAIDVPIIAGLLPIYNLKQVARSAARSNVSIPRRLVARLEDLDNDIETRRVVTTAITAEQILDLVSNGVNRVHLYTLNRADLIYAICHMVGLRPIPALKSQSV